MIWKISLQVLGKILGVFPNTLTADGKYLVEDWKNWKLPMQIQLSWKTKTFSEFFVPFLEYTSNFKHFEKKRDGHSYNISEITDCEKLRQTFL